MTDEEKEKIIEAIKTIKYFCDSRRCIQCPFYNISDHTCVLNTSSPYEWEIIKLSAR